ncbi:MAG: HPP family protein, partial [Comamonadaceae bacterium]
MPAESSLHDQTLPASRAARLRAWLGALWPAPVRVDSRERLRALVGAAVGVLVAGVACRWLAGAGSFSPWLVAPIGASAVLVFAVPASPLAQPWPVIGGNTLSALVGTACVLAIPDPAVAGAVAVGLAIAVMFQLRCLHPPGGASALLVALTHTADAQFSMFPVLANSVLLVLAGVAYNSLTGRAYPHRAPAPAAGPVPAGSRFSTADLDAALARYNQVLDISRGDLEMLLHDAEANSYRRNLGALRCGDVMSRPPVAVVFGTSLEEAWTLMRQRQIKALPVVDRAQRILGIVTVADFMRHADLDRHDGLAERLRALMRRVGTTHSEQPEVVGQIMTRQVRVASADRTLVDLVPLFSEGGHHHI